MTRIAIIGTPRSGNTWIRSVLRDSLNLTEYAVHNYRDLPEHINEHAVIQIHWPREPGIQDFLNKHNFKVVVPTRHPLDVLVSVLHFVRREPLTTRWLEGNAQIPLDFQNETPFSEGFKRYAVSFGAENLLSVSYQWSFDTRAVVIKYEDLVEKPRDKFHDLITALGCKPEHVEGALTANSFTVFRNTPNNHGWQGKPGLWQDLISLRTARHIRARHRSIFDRMGYTVPFYFLSAPRAALTWQRLAR